MHLSINLYPVPNLISRGRWFPFTQTRCFFPELSPYHKTCHHTSHHYIRNLTISNGTPSHIRKTLKRASGNRTYILPGSKPQGAPTWIRDLDFGNGSDDIAATANQQNPQELGTGIPVP